MERSVYLDLLQRWKWTLLLAAWMAGLVGFLGASQIQQSYEARARVLVGPLNTDVSTVRAAEALTLTYAEIATAAPRIQRVVDELGLDVDPSELVADIGVNATSETRILTILVTHADPATAAAIANGLADELIESTSSGLTRPEGEVTMIDPAVEPSAAVGPNLAMLTLLSAVAGLLIAAMIAMAVEYFSNTLRGSQDLVQVTGGPMLGEVNIGHGYRGTPVQPLVVEAMPESRTALGYRLLAGQIGLGGGENPVRSLLVIGSQPGEHVGELTANLSAILARTGRSVTLLDADDVEAKVTEMFVPDRRSGLSELLALAPDMIDSTDALDSVRVRRSPGIELIPAGTTESRTVREDTLVAVLETVAKRTDLVLVSGGPVDRSAQSLIWARHTDAVVVVARADTTNADALQATLDSLRLADARILGSVLVVNRTTRGDRRRPSRSTLGTDSPDGAERRAAGDKGVG